MTRAAANIITLAFLTFASVGCDGGTDAPIPDAGRISDAGRDAGTFESDGGDREEVDGGTIADEIAPTLSVESPRNGAMSPSSRVVVTGAVSDDEELESLTLDGADGETAVSFGEDGRFSVTIPLVPGENAIRLSARDAAGNETVEITHVYFGHRISVGNSQGALLRDGQLYTWGRNEYGQLGNGTLEGSGWGDEPETSDLPVRYEIPLEDDDFVSIVTRQNFMIALLQSGAVATWGNNSNGQLGYESESDCGSAGNGACRRVPSAVPGITNAIAVQAGFNHSMVLLDDGTVMTWGDNRSGQLGYETAAESSARPTTVPELADIVQLAAGSATSFALDANGKVWAWGENDHGQLGLGTTDEGARPTPTTITGLEGVRAIAAANDTAYALLADGTVRAWGRNQRGQAGVGDDSGEDVLTPTRVLVDQRGDADAPLERVVNVAGDGLVGMALDDQGKVFAWGLGNLGQLGQGTLVGGERDLDNRFHASEVAVADADREIFDIVEIEVGAGGPALALASNGHLFGWGWSFRGSLGLEGAIHAWAYSTPVLVFAAE